MNKRHKNILHNTLEKIERVLGKQEGVAPPTFHTFRVRNANLYNFNHSTQFGLECHVN